MGLVLDRLIVHNHLGGPGSGSEPVNMPAVEVIARRIYGGLMAFEDVKQESDWKQPRNSQGKWKTKVKWGLLKEYDAKSLDASDWRVHDADREVSERLAQRALLAKNLDRASEGISELGAAE